MINLKLPTYYPLTPIGGIFLYKTGAYKHLSSQYVPECDDEDGYTDEFLNVQAEDVTETNEGQALINAVLEKYERVKRINGIKKAVREHGTLIESVYNEMVAQPAGNVLFDSFSIYGSGERLIETETEFWFLINNGGDGDNWSRNTVSTIGAGAYGWRLTK